VSIVRLQRMALIGFASDKPRVLQELQEFGCIEIIARQHAHDGEGAGSPAADVREALKFLLECPERRRQFPEAGDFDAVALQHSALALQRKLLQLQDEVDGLQGQLALIRPWGDFEFPDPDELGGQRLWFYRVPHHRVGEFAQLAEPWELVRQDHAMCYIVVISPDEPEDTPLPRERIGARSRRQLEQRLQQAEVEIEEVQEQRAQLSHWCTLLARNLAMLEDQAGRAQAALHTADLDPLFAIDAWVARSQAARLHDYAMERGMVIALRDPLPQENPPTQLDNRRGIDAGEALVNFYMTPGYRTWDPSAIVLFSFALFFAMILSDAGYAALLGMALGAAWRSLGRSEGHRRVRRIAAICTGCALAYGVVAGSYFGLTPSAASLAGRAVLLDINDTRSMMTLSVLIGVLHVSYACLRDALRHGLGTAALAPLGWAAMIWGAALYAASRLLGMASGATPGIWLGCCGLALVLLFTGAGEKLPQRALKGALALTRVSGAFGDVLSYLRLFALGLASASLASAFNAMAGDVREAVPGVGLFLALCVLLLGHALNLLLGLASAVIHGLRLNVIEFFNWGLTEEGKLFRPFAKKEK
jgi:V/A-type H+/Na+-transporting ATPase subunit I